MKTKMIGVEHITLLEGILMVQVKRMSVWVMLPWKKAMGLFPFNI